MFIFVEPSIGAQQMKPISGLARPWAKVPPHYLGRMLTPAARLVHVAGRGLAQQFSEHGDEGADGVVAEIIGHIMHRDPPDSWRRATACMLGGVQFRGSDRRFDKGLHHKIGQISQ